VDRRRLGRRRRSHRRRRRGVRAQAGRGAGAQPGAEPAGAGGAPAHAPRLAPAAGAARPRSATRRQHPGKGLEGASEDRGPPDRSAGAVYLLRPGFLLRGMQRPDHFYGGTCFARVHSVTSPVRSILRWHHPRGATDGPPNPRIPRQIFRLWRVRYHPKYLTRLD
jgi:hypothetical protein